MTVVFECYKKCGECPLEKCPARKTDEEWEELLGE